MTQIKNIQPTEVWSIFDEMLQVPRPSNHEDKIQDWAVNFGESLGLKTVKDEVGNVIIAKPATPGMENRKGVIFQGHLDMVPQKNRPGSPNTTAPPVALVDTNWVFPDSRSTTSVPL